MCSDDCLFLLPGVDHSHFRNNLVKAITGYIHTNGLEDFLITKASSLRA